MRRLRVIVSGEVQGVTFRASARRQAGELGLTGFARNLSDGSVELQFQGADWATENMLSWCRVGPPAAEVLSLQVEELPLSEDEFLFRIG